MSVLFTNALNELISINSSMCNYQIGSFRSICQSGGEFSGRSVLRANYSECTPIFKNVS